MSQLESNGFNLSRKARAGALALLLVLFVLLILWRMLPAMAVPLDHTEEKELQLAWDRYKEQNTEIPSTNNEAGPYRRSAKEEQEPQDQKAALFRFDPNTVSEEDLVKLGLPPGTARTLVKYRSKGGRFYKKEDLKKLYTLREQDYERLAPYVTIAGANHEENAAIGQKNEKHTSFAVPFTVELNTADEASLMKLKGIGPAFSKRIINFRNGLGGFFAVEQLKEVYGFPDSTYQQLKDKLTADPQKVKRLNVNTATEEELSRHSYIGRKIAANIIKLRTEIKSFKEIEELRQIPLINDEKYRKIAPYLSTH